MGPQPGQSWTPQSNSKTPPSWCPEMEHRYPLRRWTHDVSLWTMATDIPAQQQGPNLALQLAGAALTLVDEIPPQQLRDGGMTDLGDAQGPVNVSGVMLLIHRLLKRFGELEIETVVRSLVELHGAGL